MSASRSLKERAHSAVRFGMKVEDYLVFNMLSGVEAAVKDQILMGIHPTRHTARINHLSRVQCGILLVMAAPGAANQSRSLLRYPSATPRTYQSFSSHLGMKRCIRISPRLRPSSGEVASNVLWSAQSTRLWTRRRAKASSRMATIGATPSLGCDRNGDHGFLSHSR